jgi:nucleoside-diphosphate-sugar epimerase
VASLHQILTSAHKALGLARAKGARFLLASTSEVYGDPLVNPQPETYADAEDSIHHPINLGNPDERSVLEIARIVLEATGSTSPLQFVPRPVDDPGVRRPDIARAQRLLGWAPRASLEDGIRRTVDYLRQRVGVEALV